MLRRPLHAVTGTRGYFGKVASSRDFRHIVKTDPRPDLTIRWCRQVSHSPKRAIALDDRITSVLGPMADGNR